MDIPIQQYSVHSNEISHSTDYKNLLSWIITSVVIIAVLRFSIAVLPQFLLKLYQILIQK
jgi:hypothetical protein